MNTHEHHHPETEGRTIPWVKAYDGLAWLVTFGKVKAFRQRITNSAGLKTGDKLLDVGCGTGDVAIEASTLVGPEGEVHASDASPKMVYQALRKAKDAGLHIFIKVDLIENLSHPDNYFDVTMNSLVMHHLPDDLKEKGLAEIYRVLKPGGHIYIVDMESSSEGSFFKRFSDFMITLHGGHNATRDQVQKMVPLVKNAGFRNIETGRIDRQFAFIIGYKPTQS